MLEINSSNSIFPKCIPIYGNLSLEKTESNIKFPDLSPIFFSRNFVGTLSGSIYMVTDLNINSLKKSQIGYIEGILSEAFNMLSQEIILNFSEVDSAIVMKMPTKVTWNARHQSEVHATYKLNLLNGYCHCGLEIKRGGIR